jgi:hypothetical protein
MSEGHFCPIGARDSSVACRLILGKRRYFCAAQQIGVNARTELRDRSRADELPTVLLSRAIERRYRPDLNPVDTKIDGSEESSKEKDRDQTTSLEQGS